MYQQRLVLDFDFVSKGPKRLQGYFRLSTKEEPRLLELIVVEAVDAAVVAVVAVAVGNLVAYLNPNLFDSQRYFLNFGQRGG